MSPEFTAETNKARIRTPKNTTYFILFDTTFSGNFTPNISLVYSYNNVLNDFKKSQKIDVRGLFPDYLLFTRENRSVFRISNTKSVSFKNIKIKVDGNYFELPLLEKSRYKEFEFAGIQNKTIARIWFQTQFGQVFNESVILEYGKDDSSKNIQLKAKESGFKFSFPSLPSISLPKEAILVFIAAFFIVFIFFIIKSMPKKSWLDKEIEELKEEGEKEEKPKN
jgi:hypothetical protein